jgi:hypothetical protein
MNTDESGKSFRQNEKSFWRLEIACKAGADGVEPKPSIGTIQNGCKNQNLKPYLRSFATGPTENREFSMPPRTKPPLGRGLACFWDRRFAVPQWGRVESAPFRF